MIDFASLRLEFVGELWYWRGPSPFHFVTLPEDGCAQLRAIANDVSYGWGMIPVWARVRRTEFDTSLWPKGGRYLLPIRDVVRSAEHLELGDLVPVELGVRTSDRASRRPGSACTADGAPAGIGLGRLTGPRPIDPSPDDRTG